MRCVKIDLLIMNHSILQVGALVRAHGKGQGQVFSTPLQGHLGHAKQNPSRTLQSDYVQGHMVVRGERAVSDEPGQGQGQVLSHRMCLSISFRK